MSFVRATPEMLENVRSMIETHAPGLDVDRWKERLSDPGVFLMVDVPRRLASLVVHEEIELTRANGTQIGPLWAMHFAAVIPATMTAAQAKEAVDAALIAVRADRPDLMDLPCGGFGPKARALAIRNAYGMQWEEMIGGQWAVWSTVRNLLAFRGL